MRTILLSFFVFATLLLFSAAAPLDKAIDEFNHILGLDVPKPSKKSLSKKGKPPGKPPGPKLFTDAMNFGFLPQIPTNVLPKITLEQDDEQKKTHLFDVYQYFALSPPGETKTPPKNPPFSPQENGRMLRMLTENKTPNDKNSGENFGCVTVELVEEEVNGPKIINKKFKYK